MTMKFLQTANRAAAKGSAKRNAATGKFVQTIRSASGDEMVVLSRAEYDRLITVDNAARDVLRGRLERVASDASASFDATMRAGIERLAEAIEERADSEAANAALAAIEAGTEERLPADVVKRLVAGESPLRVYRTYRGMTLEELGEQTDTSAAYLSMIETGKKPGSLAIFKRAATALRVDLDDLT